ncbi:hypothetical protein HSBAA_10840 [Vreelandella sulfidaeris]|uniref:Heme exporter protein D n=1 Tax=Vreelandella sulfidaeris TaxID=115553 RepID=A0A455U684_9GAMM|nr:hypothetical protein HSBAA_10840 [Halomonas sulfidaeris]
MGGHAPYVWSAWGVTALLLLATVWHARVEQRQLLKGLKRRVRRQNGTRGAPNDAKRKQKLFVILGLVSLAAIAVGLTLYALRANINLFFSPVQIAQGDAPMERQIRAGGMVKRVRFQETPRAST